MAKQKSRDPAEAFRDMISNLERGIDSLAERVTGSDEYSRTVNQLHKAQVGLQDAFSDLMTRQLSTLNMPSKSDIEKLADKLHGIERRISHIESHLGVPGAKAAASAKSPPRTKKAAKKKTAKKAAKK